MKKIGLLGLLTCLLISCEDKNMNGPVALGTYKGRFERINTLIDYPPIHVTLTFAANKFSLTTDPPLCPNCNSGTYKVTEQEIEFTNDCVQPFNFSCAEVLDGKFQLRVLSHQIEMTNDAKGSYTLVMQ